MTLEKNNTKLHEKSITADIELDIAKYFEIMLIRYID